MKLDYFFFYLSWKIKNIQGNIPYKHKMQLVVREL